MEELRSFVGEEFDFSGWRVEKKDGKKAYFDQKGKKYRSKKAVRRALVKKKHDISLESYGWLRPTTVSVQDVTRALREIDIPRTRNRENVSDVFVESVCAGVVCARSAGVVASAFSLQRPSLTRLLVLFGRMHVNEHFTSIQINRNLQCKLHVDDGNSGTSFIVGLGKYKRGELWTLDAGPVDIRGKFFTYDGSEPHCTLPFLGERITLVYFVHQTHPKLGKADRKYLESSLGFPLPPATRLSPKTEDTPPKSVKLAAGRAAFEAFERGKTVDEARHAGDSVYEEWRESDRREAGEEQLAMRGRCFVDDGVRWRVGSVFFDTELGVVCAEYYDFDHFGLDAPESQDLIEFTPFEELLTFARWLPASESQMTPPEHRESARQKFELRMDAKRAFEAADDAADYLEDLEREAT